MPISSRLTPQGVPPSGVQWPELMIQVKIDYFNLWKKGKTRFEEK
jgi:hypothetical protein